MTSPTEPKVESLRKLRERVAGLTGLSREVDNLLMWHLVDGWRFWVEGYPESLGAGWSEIAKAVDGSPPAEAPPLLTSSIDAALALWTRLFPTWRWELGWDGYFDAWPPEADDDEADRHICVLHPSGKPELGVLLGAIAAIISQETGE